MFYLQEPVHPADVVTFEGTPDSLGAQQHQCLEAYSHDKVEVVLADMDKVHNHLDTVGEGNAMNIQTYTSF